VVIDRLGRLVKNDTSLLLGLEFRDETIPGVAASTGDQYKRRHAFSCSHGDVSQASGVGRT
jgi:hypothetical protein